MAEIKRELSLRSRAVTCGLQFPEPKIMKEFLNVPEVNTDVENLKTSMPSLVEFVVSNLFYVLLSFFDIN